MEREECGPKRHFYNPLDIEGACLKYQPGYLVPKISMPDDLSEEAFKDSRAATMPITIYALEGAHGVGKTTLSKILGNLYFHVVEEDFMDIFSNFILPDNEPHNCMVEIAWASMQIINLVNMANNIRREIMMDPTRQDCFFLDRCFLTGYVYGAMSPETRTWYLKIFMDVVESMRINYNIDFKIIRLKPIDDEDHFDHIIERLEADTDGIRKDLKEGSREHLDRINAGYDNLEKMGIIDAVFETSYETDENEDGENLVVFPIGRFFETIGLERMAEHYHGLKIKYMPKNDQLAGIVKE